MFIYHVSTRGCAVSCVIVESETSRTGFGDMGREQYAFVDQNPALSKQEKNLAVDIRIMRSYDFEKKNAPRADIVINGGGSEPRVGYGYDIF